MILIFFVHVLFRFQNRMLYNHSGLLFCSVSELSAISVGSVWKHFSLKQSNLIVCLLVQCGPSSCYPFEV